MSLARPADGAAAVDARRELVPVVAQVLELGAHLGERVLCRLHPEVDLDLVQVSFHLGVPMLLGRQLELADGPVKMGCTVGEQAMVDRIARRGLTWRGVGTELEVERERLLDLGDVCRPARRPALAPSLVDGAGVDRVQAESRDPVRP